MGRGQAGGDSGYESASAHKAHRANGRCRRDRRDDARRVRRLVGGWVEGDRHGAGRAGGRRGVFAQTSKLKFVLVNHVTTNPFFVPTKYGAEDACKLLGCSYQWTGSETANVNEMVNAMNTAITSGANGIGVCLIDAKAFNAPTDAALKAKIPVVAYNADEESNNRLCYIGQDLFLSGQEMGQRIKSLVPSGDVALFIATPGSAN